MDSLNSGKMFDVYFYIIYSQKYNLKFLSILIHVRFRYYLCFINQFQFLIHYTFKTKTN